MTSFLLTLLAASPAEGTWVPLNADANQAVIERAINQASEAFPSLLGPLVLARLRETNPLFGSLLLAPLAGLLWLAS